MKRFVAIYTGSPQSLEKWKSLDAAERQKREEAGVEAWKAWSAPHRSSIVDQGTPLGKTKLMDDEGVSDVHNHMTAYTIVQAESHEAAAKMFERHPHFTIFPGEGVEVMECLPLPGSA